MDQKRIGCFLKTLRNEKHLTQEQLAERFCVTARTVSGWETGSNMPDLSILIELADFYGVDVREILKGERKREMINEEKERLQMVAEYAEKEKQLLRRKMVGFSFATVILLFFYVVLYCSQGWGIELLSADRFHGMVLGSATGLSVMNMLYLMGIWPKQVKKKQGSSV